MTTEILSDKQLQDKKASLVGLFSEYKDLNLAFKINPLASADGRGDIRPVKDINAIRNSIKNILLTRKGERPFNPLFGCNLKDYLFEPADPITTASMRSEIYETLGNQEPRVKVKEVAIENYADRNAYAITITVLIVNTQQQVDVEFYLKRVR